MAAWQEWGLVADFVCNHASNQGCARPVFVRATIAWSESWCGKSMDKVGDSPFWTWVYTYFPIIFGPKTMLCMNCKSVAILSPLCAWLFKTRMDLFDPNHEQALQFAIYDGDMKNIPNEG